MNDSFVIENGALREYTGSDTGITIPDSVTEIGYQAFSGCSSLISITIPDSVTKIGDWAFKECSRLTSITIPDSVIEIGHGAFYGCSRLTSITIPDSVTKIGGDAFSGCSSLTSVTIPDSVTEIVSWAFYGCNLPADENGFVIINHALITYQGTAPEIIIPQNVKMIAGHAFSSCRGLTSITVPDSVTRIGKEAFEGCSSLTNVIISDGVTKIGEEAFKGCSGLTSVTIPDSVNEIGEGAFEGCSSLTDITISGKLKMNPNIFCGSFPPALRQHMGELLPHMTDGLIQQLLSDPDVSKTLSVPLLADIFILRAGSKPVLSAFVNKIQDPQILGNEILNRLNAKSSSKICSASAEFMILFGGKLNESMIQEFYERLKSIPKAKEALKKISACDFLMAKLDCLSEKLDQLPSAEKQITEYLARKNASRSDLEALFQSFYSDIYLPDIKYQNGTKASPVVLQWLLTVHEELWNRDVIPAYDKAGICDEASAVIKELDISSFQSAIQHLTLHLGISGWSKKMFLAYPICRYADEALMADLTKEAPRWRSRVSGNNAPPFRSFCDACLYSNTKAAMLFADKFHNLDCYARIRSTSADDIRDLYLSDTGINELGEKSYDLGNQTVTAVLQPDLSFLVRNAEGKITKSIPKKGADPEKYTAASADFSQMKKDVKKIIKNRCAVLFEDFICGRCRNSDGWEQAYLKNPVLRSIASLLVWSQGQTTFTINKTGPILSDGSSYTIQNDSISVAHPMEMQQDEICAWQKYFTVHNLKQPFAQIWEPVVAPDTIKEDRYKGCMIPYYRFLNMEKHGITIEDYEFHNEIEINFKDCSADIERIDFERHMINSNDRFEIVKFSYRKCTRQSNHIAAYLDRITIYDRILKNDASIENLLHSFTLAQITDFLKFSVDNNCTSVTALLMNYKNEHFSDFDPMEEFTLADL